MCPGLLRGGYGDDGDGLQEKDARIADVLSYLEPCPSSLVPRLSIFRYPDSGVGLWLFSFFPGSVTYCTIPVREYELLVISHTGVAMAGEQRSGVGCRSM